MSKVKVLITAGLAPDGSPLYTYARGDGRPIGTVLRITPHSWRALRHGAQLATATLHPSHMAAEAELINRAGLGASVIEYEEVRA